jgi:hypothetical protein
MFVEMFRLKVLKIADESQKEGGMAGRYRAAALAALFLFCLVPAAYSQLSSGAILGTVTDSSGAVIPGVSITVTNLGTRLVREAVSNESGNYRVDLLPIGDYQIEANLPGFRKEVRKGVNVSIDSRVRIDFALPVGDVSEVINVEGQAPIVQTDSSGVGVVVEERKIAALPLNGRNFSQLAYIVPGAYAPRPNSQIGYRGGFQIAGGHENENQFLLDGINNNANWTSEISARVNVDAVGEFKIQTNNYGAQYGRYSGAQVDAITKSGTNEFHGDAFYFNRSNFLQARNFFDPYPLESLPPFNRHQYGAVLGGPVIKDRTFFFVAYAGQRLSSTLTVAANDPPAEFWQGDLSRITTQIRDPLNNNQIFPNNQIPKERISPIALGLREFWPTPERAGLSNNYTSHLPQPDNYNQLTVKLDHQMTSRQKVSFVETYYREKLLEYYTAGTTFPQFLGDSSINSFNVSLGHVFTLSSTLINEFRIGASHLKRGRYFVQEGNGFQNWRAVLGIQCCTQGDVVRNSWGTPIVNITGFSPIGGPNAFPQPRGETNFTVFDNISMQVGNHSLKLGGDFFRMFNNSIQSNDATGTFSFNGSRTGSPFSDFLLGLPNQANRQISLGPGTSNSRRNSMDVFFQDDWKVGSKLTLNLGIRQEFNWVMHDKYGMISRWDPSIGNSQGGFVIAPESHARFDGALATFKSYYPSIVYQDGPYKKNDLRNLSPRIGFAFAMDSKTVIRGGWGMFFNMANLGENTSASSAAPPWVLRQRLTTADGITFANPWGSAGGSTISASSGTFERPTPYVHNFNLDLQRQMPGNWVLDIAYQGKESIGNGSYNINTPLDRTTGIRPYTLFSSLNYTDANLKLHSYYNGLHIRSEKRAAKGLTFLVSYQFGKNISEYACQDAYAAMKGCVEKGLDSEDSRHRGTVSFVYQLPFGHGLRFLNDVPAVVDYLIGGWELSGIDRANSGYAFSPRINIDQSGTGDLNDRPDRIGNPDLGKAASPAAFWNKAAFQLPAKYSFGNAGVYTLRGPSFWTQDFAIAKKFAPMEKQTVTLRLELFNAFNHANFNDPVTTWNSPNFGQIISTVGSDGAASGSRQAQIGIKWIF